MSAGRPVTSGADISDEMVQVVVAALHAASMVNGEYDDSDGQWIVETKTWQYEEAARGILAAVVPLIRAQVEAELRTCQETAASLLANDSHLHECVREAAHHSPRHRCACGCEWWPLVEWERPFVTEPPDAPPDGPVSDMGYMSLPAEIQVEAEPPVCGALKPGNWNAGYVPVCMLPRDHDPLDHWWRDRVTGDVLAWSSDGTRTSYDPGTLRRLLAQTPTTPNGDHS